MASASGCQATQFASSSPSTVSSQATAAGIFADVPTALVQLDRLKKGTENSPERERHNTAQETLIWLDTVTNDPALRDRVHIEEAGEQYQDWAEVEQFMLPQTLLSIEDSESEDDNSDSPEELDSSFTQLDASDETSISSLHSLDETPKAPQSEGSAFSAGQKAKLDNGIKPSPRIVPAEKVSKTSLPKTVVPKNAIPTSLRPLFSHILWLIHRETSPGAALESFILVTNDHIKQIIAQKFGIRVKRLEQLRDAISREEREYRNHLFLNKIESVQDSVQRKLRTTTDEAHAGANEAEPSVPTPTSNELDSDDEGEVLLKRPPRGPLAETANAQCVLDPNDFGRTNQLNQPRGGRGGRGRGGSAGFPRGRGVPARGRGGFVPRGAYVPPSLPFRPPPAPAPRPTHDANGLLNPDSYERPAPRVGALRGNRRKLWEPN